MSIKTNTIDKIIARYNANSIDQFDSPKKLEKTTPNMVQMKVNTNPPTYPSIDLSVLFGKRCFFSPILIPIIDAIASVTEVTRRTIKNIGKLRNINGPKENTITEVLENVSNSSGVNPALHIFIAFGGI